MERDARDGQDTDDLPIREGPTGRIEMCCRECGAWRPWGQIDPTSILHRPEGAARDEIAIGFDFKTPLCVECVGEEGR